MNFVSRLARSLRKRIRPTERELAMKRWRRDAGESRLRYDYPLNAGSLVLDFGGYEGAWAAEIFSRYGCRVEIFEPVPAFAENIERRFANNPALHVHRCGLGAATRTEHLALCSDASSVFRQPTGATVPIELVDVKEWFERHNIQQVDLAKLNIEGGEYELLERMLDTGLASQVVHFQIQFHDLVPESAARMHAIRERLAVTHDPVYHYTFVWDGWRRK